MGNDTAGDVKEETGTTMTTGEADAKATSGEAGNGTNGANATSGNGKEGNVEAGKDGAVKKGTEAEKEGDAKAGVNVNAGNATEGDAESGKEGQAEVGIEGAEPGEAASKDVTEGDVKEIKKPKLTGRRKQAGNAKEGEAETDTVSGDAKESGDGESGEGEKADGVSGDNGSGPKEEESGSTNQDSGSGGDSESGSDGGSGSDRGSGSDGKSGNDGADIDDGGSGSDDGESGNGGNGDKPSGTGNVTPEPELEPMRSNPVFSIAPYLFPKMEIHMNMEGGGQQQTQKLSINPAFTARPRPHYNPPVDIFPGLIPIPPAKPDILPEPYPLPTEAPVAPPRPCAQLGERCQSNWCCEPNVCFDFPVDVAPPLVGHRCAKLGHSNGEVHLPGRNVRFPHNVKVKVNGHHYSPIKHHPQQ